MGFSDLNMKPLTVYFILYYYQSFEDLVFLCNSQKWFQSYLDNRKLALTKIVDDYNCIVSGKTINEIVTSSQSFFNPKLY